MLSSKLKVFELYGKTAQQIENEVNSFHDGENPTDIDDINMVQADGPYLFVWYHIREDQSGGNP